MAWEEIERRAMPIADNTEDPEWRCRSFDGFLGKGESIRAVVADDAASLADLSLSMARLIGGLRAVMVAADNALGEGRNVATEVEVGGRLLRVERRWFMSPQFSLFHNERSPSAGEAEKFNCSWDVEYEISSPTGIWLRVGGTAVVGVVQYMEEIGFCEGGHPSNPYRVDPYIAAALLFGDIREETVKRWGERLSHMRCQELAEPPGMAAEEERCVALLQEAGDAGEVEARKARDTLQWIEDFRSRGRERERELRQLHCSRLQALSLLIQKE